MAKIRQELTYGAPPARLYRALTDAAEFASWTGQPAEIDATEGGAFATFGPNIVGHNIELVADRRIVQAWRVTYWPEGVYSIVRMELVPDGDGTRLVLDHDAVPDDSLDHLDGGWHQMYWEPLRKHVEG